MARRGRKRDMDAQRHRTTRAGRRKPDLGTVELMRRRAALVGRKNQRDQRAGDPLGILQLNDVLTEDQVRAAWRFAILRWRLFGKPFPAGARIHDPYRAQKGGEPAGDPVGEERYARCCSALEQCGLLAWQEVRHTAVEQRLPAWFWRLKTRQMRHGDAIKQAALKAGLDALVKEFSVKRRRNPRGERKSMIA